jgi:hypothetical protein
MNKGAKKVTGENKHTSLKSTSRPESFELSHESVTRIYVFEYGHGIFLA